MKKTALLLIIITLASKVFGFIRELTLSYYYGTSNISDAYLIALTIPTVIFTFIGTAFSTGYIPMYSKVQKEKGESSADLFTNNLINILFVVFTIFIIAGFVFSPQIVRLFASGFEGDTLNLAIKFTQISIFGMYFTGLVQFFSGYLQIKGNYSTPALIGFPLNLIIVISIVMSSNIDLMLLPYGILIATASQFLLLVPSIIKNGYRHKFIIKPNDKYINKLLILSLPIILGAVVNDINVLVDRTLASQIAVGGISALNYANKLNTMVQSIFVLSISTAIYPTLSKMAADNRITEFKKSMAEAINAVSLLVVPATVGMMVLAQPIISLLFGRGAFDQSAIDMTSKALFFYSLGMIGFGIRQILIRGFYSLQDTKTPVINSSIGMILNIILNILLSKFMGISGLALATSISAIFTSFLLIISFRKKTGPLGMKKLLISFIKIICASIIMGVSSYLIFNTFANQFGQTGALAIAIIIGALIYFIMIYYLKIEEIQFLCKSIRKRIDNN